MADMKARLEQDLTTRNVAKQMVTDGLQHLRGDVEDKGVGARFADRMRDGADGLVDDGVEFVRENPGRVGSGAAFGFGLLFAWLFRDQISGLVERISYHAEEIADPGSNDDE